MINVCWSFPVVILWPEKALECSKAAAQLVEPYAFQCLIICVRSGVKTSRFLLRFVKALFSEKFKAKTNSFSPKGFILYRRSYFFMQNKILFRLSKILWRASNASKINLFVRLESLNFPKFSYVLLYVFWNLQIRSASEFSVKSRFLQLALSFCQLYFFLNVRIFSSC